ncbi:hypothetical protein BpHYR1_014055 [Brachionus plicatilis]|uniref:Uncharacterized protein n=1 Tax=Brachionus plicatilis TaxID=10195 RepID=A0A3M7T602_BRAPC|nr:hypothetical protein BpHYR1_014055 [Brachionus plicatilis]
MDFDKQKIIIYKQNCYNEAITADWPCRAVAADSIELDLDFTTFSDNLFQCGTTLFDKNICLAQLQNRF